MPIHPIIDDETKLAYGSWKKEWRDVIGFDKYQVNYVSQVRNKQTQQVLKMDHRFRVKLHNANGQEYRKYIYHLTLQTFFPHIPQNGRIVDHIDENHTNNYINNLQWLTRSQNSRKSNQLRPRNSGAARSKPVEQWSKDGVVRIREFKSTAEAGRETKIAHGNISVCARGIKPSAGGYVWKFKELESQQDLPNEKWETNDRLKELLMCHKTRISNLGRILTAKGIKTKGNKISGTSGHRMYRGYLVHQLVWVVWGDNRTVPKHGDELVICHDDRIPKDEDGCVLNAIDHLTLATQSENVLGYLREKAKKRTYSSASTCSSAVVALV